MYNRDMEDTMAMLAEYQKNPSVSLRNRIALANVGMVGKIAARYSAVSGEPYEDIHQIGMLGLLNAIPRFELGRGNALSSFVYPFIRGEIQHYLRDKSHPIKAPRAAVRLYNKGKKLGLDDAGTALVLGVTVVEWLEAKSCCRSVVSLNRPVTLGVPGDEWLDKVAAPEHTDRELVAEVYEALGKLRADEREAIVACMVEGITQKEHGANKNVLAITAGRRMKSGLGKLSELLGVECVC
jgi:RNA polymerase sigma-B factor